MPVFNQNVYVRPGGGCIVPKIHSHVQCICCGHFESLSKEEAEEMGWLRMEFFEFCPDCKNNKTALLKRILCNKDLDIIEEITIRVLRARVQQL